MIKLFSDIIGSDIVLSQEKAVLSPVSELLINPEDGALLGVFCFDPLLGKERILPTAEIVEIKKGLLIGKEYESITDPEDVVRIKSVLGSRSKITGSRVYTKSGQLLGRVSDATLNCSLLILDKIYVNQLFSPRLSPRELIITAKKIEEILPKKIIVSDEYAKAKKAVFVRAQASVAE